MPDFDPKTIPILDDVIETVELEDVKNKNIENDGDSVMPAPIAIDNEPLLFTAEPVVDITAEIDDESIQHESDTCEAIETLSTGSDITLETETIESALIDYSTENESDSLIEDETTDTLPEPPIESQPLITPNELQTITDDVVNQLMPELEQHLRNLIQQALKEKLPCDVISPKPTSNTNIED
jgi:hypothetical protein